MEKLFNSISIILAIAGGVATKIFGAWDVALWTLVALMCLDYATGLIKAAYTKTISSEIGYKGILKKIIILVVVAVANLLQNFTGGHVAIREIVIVFYIANEGISILENAAAVSKNMPEKLRELLLQLRDKKEDNDNENTTDSRSRKR
ncbi:MAG: phage holin family protein [Clostridia bacterium]|nr:phage holin family protein [Clostridia bacterium]